MRSSWWFKIITACIISLVLLWGGYVLSNTGQKNETVDMFPNKEIEVIVGWGQGGGTDIFARAITKPVSDKFGVPIKIRNIPGSSENVAGEFVLEQPADGYTLWAMTTSYIVSSILGNTEDRLKDYIPIARIQHDTSTIQVSGKGAFKNIDEVVNYAKANPGKLKMGGSGIGSFDEVMVALFEEAAGIDLRYIAFEDASLMHGALLDGKVDVIIEEFGPTIQFIEKDVIIPVIAFTDKRIEDFPNLPISVEKGWDVTLGVWRGLMVKAGTPPNVIDTLVDAFAEAYDDPGYKESERLRYLHLRPGLLKSDDFQKTLQQEIDLYAKVLKKLGYIKQP
ncbi:MAG: Bug family tripartite tricarboxylate transporter substrate binding protein [Bacillota bacterium]